MHKYNVGDMFVHKTEPRYKYKILNRKVSPFARVSVYEILNLTSNRIIPNVDEKAMNTTLNKININTFLNNF